MLHSLSGTMAISETSLRDVVLMAVDEINAKGGVMGKKIEPVVVDPASNWQLFAEKAKQLIVQEKVAVTFGCWTSVSRKSVLPVFENNNGLLFYPVQYEGEERYNVFYTGASPNQQLIPAAEYMMTKEGGGKKKFYLLGTDYVFPRTANKVLKAFLNAKGVPEDTIAEEYTPFSHRTTRRSSARSRTSPRTATRACSPRSTATATCRSTRSSPTRACARQLPDHGVLRRRGRAAGDGDRQAGGPPRGLELLPVHGHAGEQEVRADLQGLREEANLPGGDNRVTDDPIEAAYFGVYVWKNAVEKAGTFDIDKVRKAVYGQEFDAPGGKKKMDAANHHTYKPVLIGEILKDGQFKVVSRSKGLVKADPWSQYTSPDKGCDWIKHQGTYQKKA